MKKQEIKKEINMLIKEGEGLAVDFKEKPSGRIAETIIAFANTSGGKILIGIDDRGKAIGYKLTNKEIADISNTARNCSPAIDINVKQVGNIAVIMVPEGLEKPYSCSGGYYRRLDAVTQKMTQKEISAMYRDNQKVPFEKLTNSGMREKDLSLEKINDFLRLAGIDLKVKKGNLYDFLQSFNLIENGKVRNAAILMFAKNTGRYIQQSQIAMYLFKNHGKVDFIDRKNVRGSLLEQFNEAMAFLERHLNRRSQIVGVNRIDTYEIPIEAVREAVANAIIHRDYSIEGTDIAIEIYPDTLEISNPGGLPEGMHTSDLGNKSVRRNELISDMFFRMDKIEKAGTGIRRIREALKKAGLKEPEFESTGFFTMKFHLPQEFAGSGAGTAAGAGDGDGTGSGAGTAPGFGNVDGTGDSYTDVKTAGTEAEVVRKGGMKRWYVKGGMKISKRQQVVFELIKSSPDISIKNIADKMRINISAAQKHVEALKDKKVIRRIGPDKGGRWQVIRK